MSNSIIEWCKSHVIKTNVIVIGLVVIAAILIWLFGDWFFSGSVVTFGALHSYIFIWVSILIASIAATNSILASISARDSLIVTKESLELTRNAIRPFVSSSSGTIDVSYGPDTVTLTFQIRNSGSIPASNVRTHIDFFDKDENVMADNLSNKYRPPERLSDYGLMLPNVIHYEKIMLDLNDKGDLQLWQNIQKGAVKFRECTTYESLGRRHHTLETEQVVKLKGQTDLQLIPVIPQEWE